MKDVLKVNEGDWLWFFYQKYYTVDGKEVKHPRNLCWYFWTAVGGLISWVAKEAKLKIIWLTCLTLTALMVGLELLLPTNEEPPSVAWQIVLIPLIIIWFLSLMGSLLIPATRLWNYLEKNHPWVVYTFAGLVFLGLPTIFMILNPDARADFGGQMLFLLKAAGILSGSVFILMVLVILVLKFIPLPSFEKPRKVFHTTVAFVGTKKRKVCPLVEPPDEFEEKPLEQ